MQAVLDPTLGVVFVDTGVQCRERPTGQENLGEAEIARQIADELALRGVDVAKDLGILSPYRRQLALVKEVFAGPPAKKYGGPPHDGEQESSSSRPEILTVDEAQGRDKKCVVVSFVRSNTERRVGKLLPNWRRLNVLLTRAQAKLVLVGSVDTLKNDDLMANMVTICKTNNWVREYVGATNTLS